MRGGILMRKIFAAFLLVFAMTFASPVQAQSNFSFDDKLVNLEQAWNGYQDWRDGVVVRCNEWITLRDSPSTYGSPLARIPLGSWVRVYNWYYRSGQEYPYDLFFKVYYNGTYGYAVSYYISVR